jgi:hypothetical protein
MYCTLEAILNDRYEMRNKQRVRTFLCKWLGYGHEANTWEAAIDLPHNMVQEYINASNMGKRRSNLAMENARAIKRGKQSKN